AEHLLGGLARQALHEGIKHSVAKFAVVNNDALTGILDDCMVELHGVAQCIFADFLGSDVAGQRQNSFRVSCSVANRADNNIPPARLPSDSCFELASKPGNLATPRGVNRCSCGFAVLAFPKIYPETVQYRSEIRDLERLHSAFIHVNESAF